MKDLLNDYINNLKDNGYSFNTIQGKQNILKRFSNYLEANNIKVFNEVDDVIIERFKFFLRNTGFKAVSVANNIKRISEFYKYLEAKKIISENPLLKLRNKTFNPENYPQEFIKYQDEYLKLKEYEDIPIVDSRF